MRGAPADGMGRPAQERFANLAGRAATAAGSFWAFAIALVVIVVWAATGPLFGWSETWQLVINTGTTIVTFLMVFLIQHATNKDMRAVHAKLNELVSATDAASNNLIDAEELSDHELLDLAKRYRELARRYHAKATKRAPVEDEQMHRD